MQITDVRVPIYMIVLSLKCRNEVASYVNSVIGMMVMLQMGGL